jgi:hypothetical protein
MKAKTRPFLASWHPFGQNRRNFSDLQYNELVSQLRKVYFEKGSLGNQVRLIYGSKDDYKAYKGALKSAINVVLREGGYNPVSANSENWKDIASSDTIDSNTEHRITYSFGKNNEAGRYDANNWMRGLDLIKSNGFIDKYDINNPLIGITTSNVKIKLTSANNNSVFTTNQNNNTTQATRNPDPESDRLDPSKLNLEDESSIFSMSNILIVAGIILILFIIFGKKQAAATN